MICVQFVGRYVRIADDRFVGAFELLGLIDQCFGDVEHSGVLFLWKETERFNLDDLNDDQFSVSFY